MARNVQLSVTCACAALLAVLAACVLWGWIFHLPILTRASPVFAPTHFNTALCFLLYGAGLVGTLQSGRWLSRSTGAAIFAVGFLTLAQTLFASDFGIDTFFGYYVRTGISAAPSRMADATAAALAALGAALWFYPHDAKSSRATAIIVASLGSVPLAVATGALLGFAAGARSVTGWIGFTQVGVPTAFLCVVAGVHLLWTVWEHSRDHEIWLPIPLFVGLLTVLVTLTQQLRDDQAASFAARVQASAQQFSDRTHAHLNDLFAALDRMANRWNVADGTDERLWINDARAYLRGYRGLVALESIDAQGKVRWAVPSLENPAVIETRLRTDRLRAGPAVQAKRSGIPQITQATHLTHGGVGFLYMNPLHKKGNYDGLQIGVVRVNDFLAGIFDRSDLGQFAISVIADGVPVYSSSGPLPDLTRWTRNVEMHVGNRHWTLRVTPDRELVSRSLSSLPQIFFGVGYLVITLASLNVFLALKWRGNIQSLRDKEEKLKQSDERYELAVKGAGVGLWDFDVSSGRVYWSARYREILGITDPTFVPGRTEFESRVHPEDRRHVFTEISSAIQGGVAYDGEARVRKNDGTYIWLRLRGIPTRDSAGNVVRLSGSIDDISALKQAEDALRASEETFRVTMDSAPVGIALLAPDERLLRANRAMARIAGFSHEDELLLLDPRKVMMPSAFDEDRAHLRRLIAGEIDRYEIEHELITRNGKIAWILVNASLARNPDGSPRHVVKQVMDVSGRREMDRMKSEFISVVSHELRTPLTAIRGSLGLMATAMSSALPEKALQLVHIANRNCERLITLVNDLLDMEKLEADRMAFERSCEDLGALVRQSVEANASYGEKYGVAFRLQVCNEGVNACVDPNRFAQIMANLLSNAAKFSPPGGETEILVRRKDGHARIEVSDRGHGISDEFRPRVFERFMQADSSIARARGGTGLGLHITKQLVERMGGTIGFESTAGEGTTFWIEFPLEEAVPLQEAAS